MADISFYFSTNTDNRINYGPALENLVYNLCKKQRIFGECWKNRDVYKRQGSNTPVNMVRATLEGLTRLQTVEHVAALRGKSVEELLG